MVALSLDRQLIGMALAIVHDQEQAGIQASDTQKIKLGEPGMASKRSKSE